MFFFVSYIFYSRGLRLLKVPNTVPIVESPEEDEARNGIRVGGRERERPADKTAKHYGNGLAERL